VKRCAKTIQRVALSACETARKLGCNGISLMIVKLTNDEK